MQTENDIKKSLKTCVIFDFDGVIADTIPGAREATKESHPKMTDEQYKSLFHMKPYMDGLESIKHLRKEEPEEVYLARRAAYSKKKADAPLFEGMKELVARQSEKYLLAINTNATEQNFAPSIEKHKLAPYFDHIAFREMGPSKVARNNEILQMFSISPEQAVYITDSTGDVVEAFECGIASIAVTWGAHDQSYFEDVKDYKLFAIVDTPQELETAIENFFQKNKEQRKRKPTGR